MIVVDRHGASRDKPETKLAPFFGIGFHTIREENHPNW